MQLTDSGRIEIDLARKLNDLHQLLYTRGGIRPVNAAVEELSKLLLLEIAAERYPDMKIKGFGQLRDVVDPEHASVEAAKQAFRLVIAHPDLAGRLPTGEHQPVWPLDEPLRIGRADVLSEALRVLRRRGHGQDELALDPLGTAFDVFLSGRYEHAGGLGTYLTPTAVATAMTRIGLALLDKIDWTSKVLIGDPCCGTGRFLVAALETVRRRVGDRLTENDFETFTANGLIGADQSPSSVAKARVNLLSYGIHEPQIFTVEDSITDQSLDDLKGQMNLILTNPPFGDGKYDSREGIVRAAHIFPDLVGRVRIDPALAFIARCLDLVADGGVIGIVLPDGIIDGSSFREGIVGRRRLFEPEASIEAVVSLPSVTFSLGGTMAKTSAVFLRRGLSNQKHIYLSRADHVGYIKQGGSAAIDPDGDDLPDIACTIERAVAENGSRPTKLLSRTPMVAVIGLDTFTSVNVASLDPDAVEARETLRAAGCVELREFLRPVSRRRRLINTNDVPFISVLHVNDLGMVSWRDAKDYRPSTPGLSARPGEILISLLNPRKFRATVVPDRYPVVQCSAEFGLFETAANPYAVLTLLQHPLVRAQVAPLGRGTSSSRRRIEAEDVLGLLVPRRDSDWFAAAGRQVQEALQSCANAEDKLLIHYRG